MNNATSGPENRGNVAEFEQGQGVTATSGDGWDEDNVMFIPHFTRDSVVGT